MWPRILELGWEFPINKINDFLTKSKILRPLAMNPFLQLKRSTICTRRSNRTKADVHYELRGNCLQIRPTRSIPLYMPVA
jgi:hypothetical protein